MFEFLVPKQKQKLKPNQTPTKQKQAQLHKSQCCVRCRQKDSWGVLAASLDQKEPLPQRNKAESDRVGHLTSSCGLCVCVYGPVYACTCVHTHRRCNRVSSIGEELLGCVWFCEEAWRTHECVMEVDSPGSVAGVQSPNG